MGRLLRSTISDPIGSAINSFATFSGALDAIENNKQRRQLTDLQIQSEELKIKKDKKIMDALEKAQTMMGNAPASDIQKVMPFNDAIASSEKASQEGVDWNPSQEYKDAIVTASVHSPLITDDPNKIPEQAEAASYVTNFIESNAKNPAFAGKRTILNSENAPELIDKLNVFYSKQIKQGTDQFGLSVEKDGVDKSIKSVLLNAVDDPANPTVSFILDVKSPVKDGQVFKHIGDGKPKFTVDNDLTSEEGNEIGNIDLSQRPVRRNADGSISTVLSASFNIDGKTVLLPLLNNEGKIVTKDEAVNEYKKTGKHLGIFSSEQKATQYAQKLHSDKMWEPDIAKYSAKGQSSVDYKAPLSLGRNSDPNAPIAQVPLKLMHAQSNEANMTLAALQKVLFLSSPAEGAKYYISEITKRDQNRKIVSTLKSVPKGLKPQDRMEWLEQNMPDDVDPKLWNEIITPKGMISPLDAMKMNQEAEKIGLQKREIQRKEDADKLGTKDTEMKTIYGPGGATKEVPIKKGIEYVPPKGWSLSKPKEETGAYSKEDARRDREINNLNDDMKEELRKATELPERKAINDKYSKMIEGIRAGTYRDAMTARTKIEGAKISADSNLEAAINAYTKSHPPKDFKGQSSPDGKLKSNGIKWVQVK
jgi:hypothetical protein